MTKLTAGTGASRVAAAMALAVLSLVIVLALPVLRGTAHTASG